MKWLIMFTQNSDTVYKEGFQARPNVFLNNVARRKQKRKMQPDICLNSNPINLFYNRKRPIWFK